jgi:hypothetical protein
MTTCTAPRPLVDENSTATALPVPLPRLHLLRLGYLVIAVGILLTKWPLLLHHPQPWPLYEGVETSMLVALSLLWFLGVRYPLRMLPALLFEVAWKLIWMAVVVLPAWRDHRLDAATLQVFYACLLVVIPLAVVPWRYAVRQYVTGPGDPWHSHTAPTDARQHS